MESNIMTYIINWDRVYDDVIEKENDLLNNNIQNTVVNSSSVTNLNWMNVGASAWCSAQVLKILEDAYNKDYDYISILFGDIYAPEGHSISEYVLETKKYLNKLPDCYVYSTSFTHDGWSYDRTILKKYNDKIAHVCGTDMLYLSINKDVIKFMYGFLKYYNSIYGLDKHPSGWGIDVLCSAYSIYNRKNVFRNTSSILVHYENSGYNIDDAHKEMEKILVEGIHYMSVNFNYNKEILVQMVYKIFEKQNSENSISYEELYGI
jgi:hypothetical protein